MTTIEMKDLLKILKKSYYGTKSNGNNDQEEYPPDVDTYLQALAVLFYLFIEDLEDKATQKIFAIQLCLINPSDCPTPSIERLETSFIVNLEGEKKPIAVPVNFRLLSQDFIVKILKYSIFNKNRENFFLPRVSILHPPQKLKNYSLDEQQTEEENYLKEKIIGFLVDKKNFFKNFVYVIGKDEILNQKHPLRNHSDEN